VPLMHAVEDPDGDNGLFARRGVGQTLAKVHSWLVLKAALAEV
jgi:hypothetical protein